MMKIEGSGSVRGMDPRIRIRTKMSRIGINMSSPWRESRELLRRRPPSPCASAAGTGHQHRRTAAGRPAAAAAAASPPDWRTGTPRKIREWTRRKIRYRGLAAAVGRREGGWGPRGGVSPLAGGYPCCRTKNLFYLYIKCPFSENEKNYQKYIMRKIQTMDTLKRSIHGRLIVDTYKRNIFWLESRITTTLI